MGQPHISTLVPRLKTSPFSTLINGLRTKIFAVPLFGGEKDASFAKNTTCYLQGKKKLGKMTRLRHPVKASQPCIELDSFLKEINFCIEIPTMSRIMIFQHIKRSFPPPLFFSATFFFLGDN